MILFRCNVCSAPLQATEAQAGQLVACPACRTHLRVPQPEPGLEGVNYSSPGPSPTFTSDGTATATATANPSTGMQGAIRGSGISPEMQSYVMSMIDPRTAGRRYGFNCPYCSSRLEATSAIAAQEGQCPTCGNKITIPILDRYGRLIDPITRQIIKQAPHPVHAYAAAGERAPKIIRLDGKQTILCPRCNYASPVSANNCTHCGMPFTMEGTTIEAGGSTNGFCVASLVLGIIGIPAFCTFLAPLLAIVFGIVGLNQASKNSSKSGRGMAIAGIVLGGIGLLLAIAMSNRMWR